MIDRFNEILLALGEEFDLPLQADRHHACAIQIKQGLIVQLESDAAQEKLLIASQIVEVPPGKFRENVLKEALKMNALPDPRIGVFFVHRENQSTCPLPILSVRHPDSQTIGGTLRTHRPNRRKVERRHCKRQCGAASRTSLPARFVL